MQILFHKNSATEASITIQMEASDYRDRVSKRVKEHSEKAKIKGFRSGSVPEAVIQKMYGRSILMDEVNSLFAESLAQYLKEYEIQILGAPIPVLEKIEVIDWEHQRDFELEYLVGIVPPFTCELSKDIRVTAHKISHVTEQMVDALVAQLRQVHGKVELVDKSTDVDVIYGELHYPTQDFRVRTRVTIEKLPDEARKMFTNLHPKDKVSLDVKQALPEIVKLPGVPEKVSEAMLKLGGTVTFAVERIHRLSLAAVDQGLFDKILNQGVANSTQDFREKLKIRLLKHKQQEADAYLNQSIQTTLLKRAAIVLPEDFIKYWLQGENEVTEAQVAMYDAQYAKQLRWLLLVRELGKTHNIQVTHEEVVDEIRHYIQVSFEGDATAQQLSEVDVLQMIQDFTQKDNGEHYNKMYDSVYMHKVLNFIKGEIAITTQEINSEEFDKLVSK